MEQSLTNWQVASSLILLLIPLGINYFLGLKLGRSILTSTIRMAVQLTLVGIFLKYLYIWNNPALNLLWLFVMVAVAAWSAIKDSELNFKKTAIPIFMAFLIATMGPVLYLDKIVFAVRQWFDARYMVVFGGMILGNALRGNIVGTSAFYNNLLKDEAHYLYLLAQGASRMEAMLPYFRHSVRLAIRPSIATMAIAGIVSLPGMMTGALLGGASPIDAIRFQIVIMLAILASSISSVTLSILLTSQKGFNTYGVLDRSILKSHF